MTGEPRPARRLLIVEDDDVLRGRLARAFRERGFDVREAADAASAARAARSEPPSHALVDLRLPDASGLEAVRALIAADRAMAVVVVTGYGSIATAVEAIKLGATHYLTKPANADEIVRALYSDEGDKSAPTPGTPMSIDRLEWEHISRVLADCNGNISQAARALSMHRRTLQRKLAKRPRRR